MKKLLTLASTLTAATVVSTLAPTLSQAKPANSCAELPSYEALRTALKDARATTEKGLKTNMWATLVDRSGVICAVAYTGDNEGDQWPHSRVISAQKAVTANGFSLPGLALSTANLYSATQPGGSLFGLQASSPVSTKVAYRGDAKAYGSAKDPMVGRRLGGVNVFGGGLALYDAKGRLLGGLGVSGDSSCADHNIAWRTRAALSLDYVPAGVSPAKDDNVIYDVKAGASAGGYGHVTCGNGEEQELKQLAAVRKK